MDSIYISYTNKNNEVDHAADATTFSLSPEQLATILQALQQVGAYGEVRLVVSNQRIRFIKIIQSLPFPQIVDEHK